jgi:glycosyl-4,4'-diaponeurosporenoate acyltransferase
MALSGAAGPGELLGPNGWMALSSLAFWLLSSLLVGLLANRLPERWLLAGRAPQGPAVAQGRVVAQRRVVAPPGIRVWKRWIPDAGPALPGGIAKANLARRDPDSQRRLLIETRRAELVHWALWAAGLLTALWLPPAGVLVNLLFATAFNLPCLLLQRFNRRRVQRLLARPRNGSKGEQRPGVQGSQ